VASRQGCSLAVPIVMVELMVCVVLFHAMVVLRLVALSVSSSVVVETPVELVAASMNQ